MSFWNTILTIYSVGVLITFSYLFLMRKKTFGENASHVKEALLNSFSSLVWFIFIPIVAYFFVKQLKEHQGKWS